jgi:nitroreductase/NAD-dependent dihydropyrimidine dehydrogenase PreA subunit
MGLLIVNESKCKKDGFCVNECPSRIIELEGEGGYPRLISGGEQNCTWCGHCVAVCPEGALSHERVPVENCPAIKEELVVSEARAWQFLRSRRAIRRYQDKPVEKEKIGKLIELASHAPTGGNSQTVQWLVLTDRTELKTLAGLVMDWIRYVLKTEPAGSLPPYFPRLVAGWDAGFDTVLRSAPVVLVASAPKESPNGMVDVSIALSYLDLAAPTLGLGTCWAGLLQRTLIEWPPVQEVVKLPEGHRFHYPMMLGYTNAKYYRLPVRKNPKITWR